MYDLGDFYGLKRTVREKTEGKFTFDNDVLYLGHGWVRLMCNNCGETSQCRVDLLESCICDKCK